jgi:hypothetical protein
VKSEEQPAQNKSNNQVEQRQRPAQVSHAQGSSGSNVRSQDERPEDDIRRRVFQLLNNDKDAYLESNKKGDAKFWKGVVARVRYEQDFTDETLQSLGIERKSNNKYKEFKATIEGLLEGRRKAKGPGLSSLPHTRLGEEMDRWEEVVASRRATREDKSSERSWCSDVEVNDYLRETLYSELGQAINDFTDGTLSHRDWQPAAALICVMRTYKDLLSDTKKAKMVQVAMENLKLKVENAKACISDNVLSRWYDG